MSEINKTRFWVGVCYPENMFENWELLIGDILQLPYCYTIHTLDLDKQSEHRKDHVHIIIVFSNTTTRKHANEVFNLLSAPGQTCCPGCLAIVNIRNQYNYLIHDTETCRKLGKTLYPADFRICGNNFDIGLYEQIGLLEKNSIIITLCQYIVENKIINFTDFFIQFMAEFDDPNYLDCLKTYSGLFERLTKGNYLKFKMGLFQVQGYQNKQLKEGMDFDE